MINNDVCMFIKLSLVTLLVSSYNTSCIGTLAINMIDECQFCNVVF